MPKPLPLGDLVVVNTINDTLKWTKVDSVKAFYHAVGTGDLNGDGLVDVVGVHLWSHYWPEGVHPFLQNKNGTYSEARNLISKSVYENRCGSGAVLITDILGDKTPEIIRGSYGYTGATGEIKYAFQILSFDPSTKQFINAYEPKNLGMFSYTSYGGQNATSMKTADFDHNGFKDLAICSEGVLPTGKNGSIIQIWLNNGKGEFIPDQYIMNNADDSLSVREFEVADIDNDGWPDIVMHGNGGVTYRGKLPNSNYGHFFKLNNLIWKNNKGVFDIIPNQLNVYDSTNIELIGNSNFLKGFMVNGKLKYIGFESADAINPTKLYEITVNFCNNLIKPAFSSSKYSFCTGDSLKLTVSNINKGDTLKWYYGSKSDLTNLSNKTFTDSTKLFVTRTDSSGCVISSDTVQIKKYSIPTAPTLVRDADNNLVSGASGTTWYKDGVAITDTTQKYKPAAAGSYTAKTTTNGCTSALSAAYYYLVTDIINLSKDEYIKLAPNPFVNQLNFDFVVKGYQKLNIEVFDIATGTKVASQLNVTAGSRIALGQLSGGTYIIRVTSNDQKIVQQFKVVKM
ncbi:MAG: T9SS type A sorting domain-containing protein [Chitinophagia bacterium]